MSTDPISPDPDATPEHQLDPAEENPVADDPADAPENQPTAAPAE